MRNQKGITLIALIVTIIVLIIIAGISIATLTADNGILKQVDSAKVANIEGTVKEEVDLACAAFRLAIAQEQAENRSYKASEKSKTIQGSLVTKLNEESTLKGATFATSTTTDDGKTAAPELKDGTAASEFYITFTSQDYQNSCNSADAKIIIKIALGQSQIGRTGFVGFDTSSTIDAIKPSEIGG